ncbi:hypothetical protein [Peribacillus alkalitolerans]|uniref:hypothetical protein n=1 Tax=Peribacillus alkalitolerans TaxID=1550385 RepID=UPI0013CF957C|nr:hypothetical protein [Peribacillus alkalitolerans]
MDKLYSIKTTNEPSLIMTACNLCFAVVMAVRNLLALIPTTATSYSLIYIMKQKHLRTSDLFP